MTLLSRKNENTLKSLGPRTLIIGLLLVLTGMIGVTFPLTTSFVTDVYIALLLLIGGVVWGYQIIRTHPGDFMNWLKPLLLVVTGGLMLYSPFTGVAAVGMLLSFYLFLDAFGSLAFAKEHNPAKGWGWMTFNGIVSLLLAVLILIGWPDTSLVLVGIYVGVSLIFDGWALIVIGWHMRKGHHSTATL